MDFVYIFKRHLLRFEGHISADFSGAFKYGLNLYYQRKREIDKNSEG